MAIYLFFATAIGIFLGTVARSMPQLGLLYLLVYRAADHAVRQQHAARKHAALARDRSCRRRRSTHFVSFAQAILYRGAGFAVVWPQFVIVALIGGIFFGLALLRFRKVAAAAM